MSKYLLLFMLIGMLGYGQQKLKPSLSEKCWAILHPFKVKKAIRITKEVQKTVDSIAKEKALGANITGNQLDAFKHAFWMYKLSEGIGWRSARSLGRAHEKGNYHFYKKNKKEDGVLPDEKSSLMDLYNNNVGIALYRSKKKETDSVVVVEVLLGMVKDGEMQVLQKDSEGSFVDCQGNKIDNGVLKGKWKNDKCLVPSNRMIFHF